MTTEVQIFFTNSNVKMKILNQHISATQRIYVGDLININSIILIKHLKTIMLLFIK